MMTHKPRSYAVDLARGLCLVIMTVDHLHGMLGRFTNVVFGPFGFFTATSGFVFLSGLVSAWAYGSIYRKHGLGAAWRATLRRASTVYVVNTSLFLLIFVGVWLNFMSGSIWQSEYALLFSDPLTALYQGLLLVYRPGYLNILPMYILFLLVVMPALAAIRASWAWLVMGLSALTWAWVQISSPESACLNAFGYQILFVAGLVIGSTPDIESKLHSAAGMRIAQASMVLAVCMLLARVWLGLVRSPGFDIPGWQTLVDVGNNGPLRLVNFALFAVGAVYLWRRTPGHIKNNRVLQWLAHLGRHSLPVFAWSVLLTSVSVALRPTDPSRLWSVIDLLLVVSSLTIPAALHAWYTQRSRLHPLMLSTRVG